MIANQFQNFEDFKNRFGFKTGEDGKYLVNANGVRQRKNNIVYQYWKEHFLYLKKVDKYSLKEAFDSASKHNTPKDVFREMLITVFGMDLSTTCPVISFNEYKLLNSGICLDGDVTSVRYENTKTGHIYKMKIGKYVNKCLDNLPDRTRKRLFWLDNPTLRIFFIEEITELWKNKRLKDMTMRVVVNKDFQAIYNPDLRPEDARCFDSCMDGDNNWNYYKDHDNIYDAVSLQDEEGLIYARAILVTCYDKNDQEHKYLERIYCNKRMYKDLLFEKAKAEGLFDLYKGLDASCHESKAIKKVSDDKTIDFPVYINLELEEEDWLSYQDTFKWYYPDLAKAYNYEYSFNSNYNCYHLDITNETFMFDD